MEILQETVIHFSFDMKRTFASFSGHTLSAEEVLTKRRLELQKNIEIWLLRATKFYDCFYCNGDNFNVKQL